MSTNEKKNAKCQLGRFCPEPFNCKEFVIMKEAGEALLNMNKGQPFLQRVIVTVVEIPLKHCSLYKEKKKHAKLFLRAAEAEVNSVGHNNSLHCMDVPQK